MSLVRTMNLQAGRPNYAFWSDAVLSRVAPLLLAEPSGSCVFKSGLCDRRVCTGESWAAGQEGMFLYTSHQGKLCACMQAEGGGEGGRVAYVVFSQPEEVDRALVLCAGGDRIRCDIGSTGVGKWCEGYASTRPKPTSLDAAAKLVVGKFGRKQSKNKYGYIYIAAGQYDKNTADQQKVRKRLSEPDSDGWVTVTSKRPQSVRNQTCKLVIVVMQVFPL